jgi:fluoride exporter
MPSLVLVMIGGALGAGLRFLFGEAATRALGTAFPWGTWGVNLIGGLAMGLLVGLLARTSDGSEDLRLLLGVGVLGGFTTFSAFSLEAYAMIVRGEAVLAGAYAMSSVAGSVIMLWAGIALARSLP